MRRRSCLTGRGPIRGSCRRPPGVVGRQRGADRQRGSPNVGDGAGRGCPGCEWEGSHVIVDPAVGVEPDAERCDVVAERVGEHDAVCVTAAQVPDGDRRVIVSPGISGRDVQRSSTAMSTPVTSNASGARARDRSLAGVGASRVLAELFWQVFGCVDGAGASATSFAVKVRPDPDGAILLCDPR